MKRPEWPGIATTAALVCAGTIIFAIWRDPEGFKLKDWQTFMAACIALVGGAMAYRGAIAKVHLDTRLHDQMLERKRLAVFLKTQSMVSIARGYARVNIKRLERPPAGSPKNKFRVAQFKQTHDIDFNDAWSDLEFFPPLIAQRIARLRNSNISLQRIFTEHLDETIETLALGDVDVDEAEEVRKAFGDLEDEAEPVLRWLQERIGKLDGFH